MTSEVKIENNLFNDKKMEEFIQLYDDELTVNADCDPISYWIKKLDNNELKSEKTNYIRFFKIILENILGYEFTDIQYEESIGDEGRPVEFTLKKGDKDYVVVELKGTTCKDLNKRYNREQSPIEQVTNYASIKEETQWAFVSNYDEFRFFNPSYREKYISFKFKQLTDPNVLKRFLLIFGKFSLIDKDIPQTLLKETRMMERDLEYEFYKLFSETRLMIIKELKYNEKMDNIEAIRIAQLILNRFIFLCFTEDLHLIPSETTADILLTPIIHKNLTKYTMWNRLNELFEFANEGNEEKGINAFNGGLFKEDLYGLKIRDKVEDLTFFDDCYKTWKFEEKYEEIESLLGVYKNTLNPIYKNLLLISTFDFGSELSVNILGHIFENSIGDIEELKNETKERRKKDGVFYTPEYITDYICRNTIIPYLSISGKASTIHELISEYEKYDNLDELDIKLKTIKIIDPACGSGAFLNKAVDILFEIHEALHNSKYANDESLNKYFDSLDSRKQIISNNIYGVDLNEESVEITKLSLFLKLATSTGVMQGFKLPNLDKNIKCGNSIISDENLVGEKAFEWENEFKDVFSNDKFNIVVGNPPYGAKLSKEEQKYLNKEYIKGGSETAISFIKLAYDKLLKNDGKLSYIVPKSFTFSSNYIPIREEIFNNIDTVIDCKKVWKEVKLEQTIFMVDKSHSQNYYNNGVIIDESIKLIGKIPKQTYSTFKILLNDISIEELSIATKLNKTNQFLNDISYNSRGGVFQKEISPEGDSFVLGGAEIQRNGIIGIKGKINKSIVEHDDKNIIKENSVLVQRLVSHITKPIDHIKITACIPNNLNYFIVDTINQITVNEDYSKFYVWSLLNSKLINWYCYRFIYAKAIRTMQFDNPVTSKIPIPQNNDNIIDIIIEKSEKLYEHYLELNQVKNKFLNRVKYHFEGIKINKTLNNYETLDFNKFNKQLKKQKFKMSLKKEEEWEDYFIYSQNSCLSIESELNKLEHEINNLIYKLYELTDEEIAIIENSFNK